MTLRWTKERPTRAGAYWYRIPIEDAPGWATYIAWLTPDGDTAMDMLVWDTGCSGPTNASIYSDARCEWAGPIEPPEEPGE